MLLVPTEIPRGSNTKTEVKETSRSRLNLFKTPAIINIHIYSENIIKTKLDYVKGLPTITIDFQSTKNMTSVAINPVGIYLNLDNVQDRKNALKEWQDQMHMCFASNESWDAESCRRYAEQSLKGIVKNYLDSLRTAINASSI